MWNDIKPIESSDTNVMKFVFTKDNAVAEAVLYKYPTYENRTVICCSTMSGCPVGCGQLWFVQEWMRNNPELARKSCGNGKPIVHAPQAVS